MGFKKQVISCNSPYQILQLTLTHLECVKNIIQDPVTVDNIQGCVDRCISTYGNLTSGQWLLLRQSLLRFLQGKKIKVSLFLQQGLQTVDGSLIMDLSGRLPYGAEMPGKIRLFEGNTMVRSIPFDSPVTVHGCSESEDVFDMSNAQGKNMYMKEKEAMAADAKSEKGALSAASYVAAMRIILNKIDSFGASNRTSDFERTVPQAKSAGPTGSTAKAELNLLADLLGMGSKETADEKPFKFSLFPDDGYSSEGKSSSNVIVFDIDGSAGSKTVDQYMNELNLKDEPKGAKGSDDDDLLALMDSAK